MSAHFPLAPYSPDLSDMEARHYYAGLPSLPRLVARTGTAPWVIPTGPWNHPWPKQLGAVFNHKLNSTWEDNLAFDIHACLDKMKVMWTSTDIVRIGMVGESYAPVVLWIGVKPQSLGGEDGKTAAFRCLDILKGSTITDVDVEIRESSVIRSAGPRLLPPVRNSDPISAVCRPLTHVLRLPISTEAMPYVSGTGGFYMGEGGESNNLLLVTARHVVFPFNKETNTKSEHNNEGRSRYNVHLSDKAYTDCLASIKIKIKDHEFMIQDAESCIDEVEGQDGDEGDTKRKNAQYEVDAAAKAMKALLVLHTDIERDWSTRASRNLGHVIYSPPVCLGAGTAAEQYTEDYAIIKVDGDKIDRTKFQGNVIDLGAENSPGEFTLKMNPNPKNASGFEYPYRRLLKLSGTISDEEMRHPTMLDENDEPCLVVIKGGSSTGVTIGRANGIVSYIRECSDDRSHQTSKEWAILPYDGKSGAFSAPGDSGAVVVDGLGRMGGLLTSGANGKKEGELDISYATPMTFLEKSIKAKFPKAHFNLV